jgi:hypothetical protein
MIDWTKPIREIKSKLPLFYVGKTRNGMIVLEDKIYGLVLCKEKENRAGCIDIENIPPKRKRYIFEETGEKRNPKTGEFVTNNEFWPNDILYKYKKECLGKGNILKLIKVEEIE